jgi:hypothetical protein
MSATTKPSTWLLIFDPKLRSNDGHSRNYDFAVAEAARDIFDRVVIFADAAFAEPPPAGVMLRIIAQSLLMSAMRATVRRAAPRTNSAALPNAPAGSFLVPFQRIWKGFRARGLAYSFARAIREAGCNRGDNVHIFVQQADLYEIVAVDSFRARYGGSALGRVTFHLLMRHDPEITRAGQEDLSAFRARLLRLSRVESPRVCFHTDSTAIADGFQGLTEHQAPWNVVPIPVSRKASLARLQKTEGPQNRVRIRMLGSPRMERGFGTLRALIPSFPGYFSECRVCFAVQVDRRFADPLVGHTIQWLDDYARQHSPATPELELLNGPVDDDIYFSWMAATDILIAPYTSIKYRQSTSGVFVEALHLGVPSIVMQGTWAARIVADAADRGLRIGEIAATLDVIPQVAHRLWSAHSRYRADLEVFSIQHKSDYGSGVAELLLHADRATTGHAGGEHSST